VLLAGIGYMLFRRDRRRSGGTVATS